MTIPWRDTLAEIVIWGVVLAALIGVLFGRGAGDSGGSGETSSGQVWLHVDQLQQEARRGRSARADQESRIGQVETENVILRERVAELERRLGDP